MTKYIKGNILELSSKEAQIIVQQCNCTSSSAKGLSKDIAEKFEYADFYSNRTEPSTPGTISIVGRRSEGRRYVCAFFAQKNPGKPKKGDTEEDRIGWFRECLNILSKKNKVKSVAFPYKIGCGLAGGNWDTYSALIEQFALDNPNIKVFVIDPNIEPDLPIDGVETVLQDTTKNEQRDFKKKYPKLSPEEKAVILDFLTSDEGPTDIKSIILKYMSDNDLPSNISQLPEVCTYKDVTLRDFTYRAPIDGWESFFNMTKIKRAIDGIGNTLRDDARRGIKLYPEMEDIYRAFEECAPDEMRVIIIGQDPYYTPGAAMGLSFSHHPSKEKLQPSLRNIYIELKSDGYLPDMQSGDLLKWAQQGVFLINTALTVQEQRVDPNDPKKKIGGGASHCKVWSEFTKYLFEYLNNVCEHLVIIAWGAHAQNYLPLFSDTKHKKIASVHPSPMSADKGFFGSKPFSKTNEYLEDFGYNPIDWNLKK